MEIDIDNLSSDDVSELRILLKSPGWAFYEELLRTQRYIYLDRNLNEEPEVGESVETFALREYGKKKVQMGMLLAISIPLNIVENFEEPKEAEEDGNTETESV